MSTRAERIIRDLVLERDHYTCQVCGRPAHDAGHIIARHHGGDYTLDNLEAQCSTCNRGDGHRISETTAPTRRHWLW